MGTPNFAVMNASRIFAFGMNKYTSYNEETDCYEIDNENGAFDAELTEQDAEDALLNVETELNNKDYISCERHDGNRSFPRKTFAFKLFSFEIGQMQFELEIEANYVCGYYEGAAFDWDAKVFVYPRCGGYSLSYDATGNYAVSEEDVLRDDWMDNKGLSKIFAKRFIKRIDEELDKLTKELEEVYAEYCENKLACIGHFSNGEAIYEEVV